MLGVERMCHLVGVSRASYYRYWEVVAPDEAEMVARASIQENRLRRVLHSRPSTDRASLAASLSLIGLLTPAPTGDSASPPDVTRCSSVPCHPQTPWCGG
jgi:hypothetical protein